MIVLLQEKVDYHITCASLLGLHIKCPPYPSFVPALCTSQSIIHNRQMLPIRQSPSCPALLCRPLRFALNPTAVRPAAYPTNVRFLSHQICKQIVSSVSLQSLNAGPPARLLLRAVRRIQLFSPALLSLRLADPDKGEATKSTAR